MTTSARRLATAEDLLALGDDSHAEVLDGMIVEKASPTAEHGDAQGGVVGFLRHAFHRRGGWWILPEVDVELEAHQVIRPDVAGWRRDRVPERPQGRPLRTLPDWVCEVVSASNASNDLVTKQRLLHYWLVNPAEQILTVQRWSDDGYTVVLTATRGERVRAEPFDAIELQVGLLFGDDPED